MCFPVCGGRLDESAVMDTRDKEDKSQQSSTGTKQAGCLPSAVSKHINPFNPLTMHQIATAQHER